VGGRKYYSFESNSLAVTPKTWAKAIYGVGIRFLLDECAGLCADLTELECRHFFEEGYLAAKREA